MTIARSSVNEFLDRELDDFRWMKKLVAAEIERELRQLRTKPQFKTSPWLHQLVCFFVGLYHPRFLFLLDMGLGKTKILLDLLTQTQREKRLVHGLVTVPRVTNMSSWRDDVLKHSDLEPNPCNISDIEGKRERLLNPTGDLTIIDYMGLHLALSKKVKSKKGAKLDWHEPWVRQAQKLYNWVGIDESHMLSGNDTLWFRIMNQLTKSADHVYASTGTLFGKNVEDLWSQFYLVDGGETFGPNMGIFREALFTADSNGYGTVWTFNKRRQSDLNRMLQHRSIRYDEREVPELDLPALTVLPMVKVDMEDEQRQHYLKAVEGLINAAGSPTELEAPWIRMRQITSGYLAWKDAAGGHVVRFKHNPKLEALERLVLERGEGKMIICHEYTETGTLISERLDQLKVKHLWLYGGAKDKGTIRDRFMQDPSLGVLLMNAASGGTGNDGLQEVARYMVFYESPPSPTTRHQTVKRIHRPGQKRRTFVYDLVCTGTVDKGILDDIAAGRSLYEDVVNGKVARSKLLGLARR